MLIYPKATEVSIKSPDGGSMVGGPPRSIIHTTETDPKWGFFRAKNYYSIQFLFNIYEKVEILQTFDLARASRALFNGPDPVQTNRMGTYNPQVVIIGYAKNSPSLPKPLIHAMSEYFVWQEEKMEIPPVFPLIFQGGESYGKSGVGRMTVPEWRIFTGIGGHQDVPDGNLHWDPGKIPVIEFVRAIASIKGESNMATYRGVKNVPSKNGVPLDWVKNIIDRHVHRGVINITDDAPDDWIRDGRLWIFLDRTLQTIERQLEDKDTKINTLTSTVNRLSNQIGQTSGGNNVDVNLRKYLKATPL